MTADDILNLARRVFDRSKASLAVVGQPDSEDTYRELLVESALHLLAEVGDHIPTGDNTAEDTASVHYRYKILRCDQIDHILHACINRLPSGGVPQLNLTDGQLFEGCFRVMQHQPQKITFGDRSGVFALGIYHRNRCEAAVEHVVNGLLHRATNITSDIPAPPTSLRSTVRPQ